MAAIEALRERYPAHEVVVVSHGGVMQSICVDITGMWSEDYPPSLVDKPRVRRSPMSFRARQASRRRLYTFPLHFDIALGSARIVRRFRLDGDPAIRLGWKGAWSDDRVQQATLSAYLFLLVI